MESDTKQVSMDTKADMDEYLAANLSDHLPGW